MHTAKLIGYKDKPGMDGKPLVRQYHLHLSKPLDGNEYVVCSVADHNIGIVEIKETYIFPADEDGIKNYCELDGSVKDVIDYVSVMKDIGYTVVK